MMPAFAALDAAVALFKRFRTPIAILPFAALCAFLWVKLYGFLWWDGAIEQRDKAIAEVVQLKAVSEKAKADQLALNLANQELSKRIAENAQARHAEITRATNSAIADYARRNRVQDYCSRGTSGTAPVHPDPGGTPESGTVPDLVAIPRDEFETLARKAVQDDRKTSFLIELVNEGLAVAYPEPELGK